MMRLHGKPPFTAAVIHGGPGACGSLYALAHTLSAGTGVLEPIQSRYEVEALVQELLEQLSPYAHTRQLVVIGHSWGAWLSLLAAERRPDFFKHLVLIGCPPLTPHYAQQIQEKRLENLSLDLAQRYVQALKTLTNGPQSQKPQAMKELDVLCSRADNVCPVDLGPDPDGLAPDAYAFETVWPQAQTLRENGSLLKTITRLHPPVTLIQGLQDPHPAKGVTEPFSLCKKHLNVHLLPRCGHSPFAEKYAQKSFYQIMRQILN